MPPVDDKNVLNPPPDIISKSAKSMPFDCADPDRFERLIQIPVPTAGTSSGYAKASVI
jgi:hypothetical protein